MFQVEQHGGVLHIRFDGQLNVEAIDRLKHLTLSGTDSSAGTDPRDDQSLALEAVILDLRGASLAGGDAFWQLVAYFNELHDAGVGFDVRGSAHLMELLDLIGGFDPPLGG